MLLVLESGMPEKVIALDCGTDILTQAEAHFL